MIEREQRREICSGDLKVLQMDVLQAVDNFCRDNNIRYSMACGTLLGAVRHEGYIPWDDDIDIYLLRDDYDKLMRLFPKVYQECYCISSIERDPFWDKPYAKAYDNRTIVVEEAEYDGKFGVNIDVYPIDDVPDDETEWVNYDSKRRKLYKKYNRLLAFVPFRFSPIGIVRWLRWNYPKWFTTRRQMAKRIDAFSQKWRNKGYKRVFECCQGQLQQHPFNKCVFDKITSFSFEDRSFMGFENYDEYLRNGYGDYMTLPPEEKRVTHHFYKAYWKD